MKLKNLVLSIGLLVTALPVLGQTYSSEHEKVKNYFISNAEPKVLDAVWTARDIFKVGVVDDGTNRSGYAQYVCEVLPDYGFKGKRVMVDVIDVVRLNRTGKWISLGKAHCR